MSEVEGDGEKALKRVKTGDGEEGGDGEADTGPSEGQLKNEAIMKEAKLRRQKKAEALALRRAVTDCAATMDIDSGMAAFHKMVAAGVTPRVDVFNVLVHVASETNRLDMCGAVIEEMVKHGVPPDEATRSKYLKGLCAADRADEAFAQADIMRAAGMKLRIRLYSPLLGMLARFASGASSPVPPPTPTSGDASPLGPPGTGWSPPDLSTAELAVAKAVELFQEATKAGFVIADSDFAAMTVAHSGVKDLAAITDGILPQMMETVFTVAPDVADSLSSVFTGLGWNAKRVTIGPDGACAATGQTLRSLELSEEEMRRLADQCAGLATMEEARKKHWEAFVKWLGRHGPYDILIDGANVGFHGQNHSSGKFNYAQIDRVLKHFQAAGKRVLLVLHSKWFNAKVLRVPVKRKKGVVVKTPYGLGGGGSGSGSGAGAGAGAGASTDAATTTTDGATAGDNSRKRGRSGASAGSERSGRAPPLDPAQEAALRERWKSEGSVYSVPRGTNDDWFWMYAAVYAGVHAHVVTNDQMRDHHFNMLAPRDFLKWRERHQLQFKLTDKRIDMYYPTKYSHRTQPSAAGDAWYFPITDTSNQWLVVWK